MSTLSDLFLFQVMVLLRAISLRFPAVNGLAQTVLLSYGLVLVLHPMMLLSGHLSPAATRVSDARNIFSLTVN